MSNILVLPGDGVGPEVVACAIRVLEHLANREGFELAFTYGMVGGACYDRTGCFLTDETLEEAREADAVLFGSEGGPKWDGLELDGPPEARSGLARLRRKLNLFANVRPIRPMKSAIDASTLKPEAIADVTGRVEMDDAYLGGRRSGAKRGRGAPGKTPFVAAVQTTADGLELDGPPEARSGLARLRRKLNLFANVRPIRPMKSAIDASTLKPEAIADVDFIILRELCGGIYFGAPRGISRQDDGHRIATDTLTYAEWEIERIAHVAFSLAQRRNSKLVSVDKANVLESSVLWRQIFSDLNEARYPDIDLEHQYVDNAAMQLVRNPRQYDVIVTENLFGDILSDGAAMITGSLGMLPSASLGARPCDGGQFGLYEPVHGSANDIAGQGLANPLGAILSAAMLLEYSLDRSDLAKEIELAVSAALDNGLKTPDMRGSSSSSEVADAVIAAL